LGNEIVRIGVGRRTRYALRRPVRQCGSTWSIERIDPSGTAHHWAKLHALHGGFLLEMIGPPPAWLEEHYPDGHFPDLPFFLFDLRPQGFLGRAVARDLSKRAALPPDPRLWNADDVLDFLLHHGPDLAGNFVISGTRVAFSSPAVPVAASDRARVYSERAEQALRGDVGGSSAGGEQPKFSARIYDETGALRDVLVKFSPPRSNPAGERWADLLAAEACALRILSSAGLPAAKAQIIDAGDRRFLEVRRFDRAGRGGRHGLISLTALAAGLSNADHSLGWLVAASTLAAEGLITADTLAEIKLASCFGRLIANTDMHGGNLSFLFGDATPFPLAPIYDMLPMAYAPSGHGELPSSVFDPQLPPPSLQLEWNRAHAWARQFWSELEQDPLISPAFRKMAGMAKDCLLLC
jgi:hypothetical protein